MNNICKDILEVIFDSNNTCYSHKDIIKFCLVCKNIDITLFKKLYLTNINSIDNYIQLKDNCYKIIELRLIDTNVGDLSFFKLCVNMKTLYLKNVDNDNLLNVRYLHNLKYLTLSNMDIYDISFITTTNLKLLTLCYINISNIEPIQLCNNLKKMYIKNTYLNNYSHLTKCKSLSKIHIYNSPIHFHDMRYLTENNIKVYSNIFT